MTTRNGRRSGQKLSVICTEYFFQADEADEADEAHRYEAHEAQLDKERLSDINVNIPTYLICMYGINKRRHQTMQCRTVL